MTDQIPQLPNEITIGVRPEDIEIRPDGSFKGQVLLTEPLGVETIVHINSGDDKLLSIIPGTEHISVGQDITFNIMPSRLHFFDNMAKG